MSTPEREAGQRKPMGRKQTSERGRDRDVTFRSRRLGLDEHATPVGLPANRRSPVGALMVCWLRESSKLSFCIGPLRRGNWIPTQKLVQGIRSPRAGLSLDYRVRACAADS